MSPTSEGQFVTLGLHELWTVLVLRKRTIAVVAAAALALAALYNATATRWYEATSILQLTIQAGQEVKTDKVNDLDQYHRWHRDLFVTTQLDILRSRALATEVVERHRALGQDPLVDDVDTFLDLMDIRARDKSDLIDIRVQHTDPEQAAILANLVAEVYREHNLDATRDAAVEARSWISQQLESYQAEVDAGRGRVRQYLADHDLADIDEAVTELSARAEALHKAHAAARTARIEQQARVEVIRASQARTDLHSVAKSLDSDVSALAAAWTAARAEHAEAAARYGDRHPVRIATRARLDQLEDELERDVDASLQAEEADLEVLAATEERLAAAIDTSRAELLERHRQRDGYQQLELGLARTQAFYDQLSRRDGELQLQSQTQLNNVRVVDPARAAISAVWPRSLLNLAASLLLGLMAGVGVALLRDYVDDSLVSPLEVTRYLDIPYLGLIPRIDVDATTQVALHAHHQPTSAASEALRSIRTVLDMNPLERPLQRLLVTSAVKSEGKTSTSVLLGTTFAKLGRRVVIVDADLRRPRLHKVFDADRGLGLSDVFAGGSLDDVLRRSPVDGMSYLTVGSQPEGATELLASVRMTNVLAELDERFDLVILDSPPSVLIADAAILSRSVDGIALVVREGTASRKVVFDAVRRLRSVGADILGVIVNDLDVHRSRSAYYADYYRYGYAEYRDDAVA